MEESDRDSRGKVELAFLSWARPGTVQLPFPPVGVLQRPRPQRRHAKDKGNIKLTLFDCWIAGPSAMGSEKGTPSSITSAPPFSRASIRGTEDAFWGYPAVRKVTNAGRPC